MLGEIGITIILVSIQLILWAIFFKLGAIYDELKKVE